MKEELYYLVPKEELDLISRQLEVLSETNNCGLTNDKAKEMLSFKLIDLSDEAIEVKANKEIKSEIGIIYYKQALIDLKQKL